MTGMAREHRTRAGIVHLRASSRDDGDFHIDGDAATLDARRRAFVDRPWSMLLQSHGTDVVLVDRPGAGDRDDGDIAVVTAADAVVGVWTADCAPLVIVDDSGVFAGVHAGWRGLAAGVIDVAVAALAAAGASGRATAYLGACIHPCCYEFGATELAEVAAGVGVAPAALAATTADGAPALDVPAAATAALARHGVTVTPIGGCTGCDRRWYSHRARVEPQRHVLAAWRSAA